MGLIAEKLASAPATVLVILDPLYLAAQGAKGSSLFDMGAQLENIQTIAQAHGAALVVHHWNQTGKGSGLERASGAGPVEWGRVLASASIKSRHVEEATKATAVTIDMEFLGDEIPESTIRLRRHVWTDDPKALDSPMHYRIERLAVDRSAGDAGELGGEKPAVQRSTGCSCRLPGPSPWWKSATSWPTTTPESRSGPAPFRTRWDVCGTSRWRFLRSARGRMPSLGDRLRMRNPLRKVKSGSTRMRVVKAGWMTKTKGGWTVTSEGTSSRCHH